MSSTPSGVSNEKILTKEPKSDNTNFSYIRDDKNIRAYQDISNSDLNMLTLPSNKSSEDITVKSGFVSLPITGSSGTSDTDSILASSSPSSKVHENMMTENSKSTTVSFSNLPFVVDIGNDMHFQMNSNDYSILTSTSPSSEISEGISSKEPKAASVPLSTKKDMQFEDNNVLSRIFPTTMILPHVNPPSTSPSLTFFRPHLPDLSAHPPDMEDNAMFPSDKYDGQNRLFTMPDIFASLVSKYNKPSSSISYPPSSTPSPAVPSVYPSFSPYYLPMPSAPPPIPAFYSPSSVLLPSLLLPSPAPSLHSLSSPSSSTSFPPPPFPPSQSYNYSIPHSFNSTNVSVSSTPNSDALIANWLKEMANNHP
ncbi:leucine-rich repeat extensin-like protein 5 [Portunus trituberculatus]|uniref:leucine-rich repeat extensin-like protein 5 n=1 Tax=Portunus trituberculatus TaxID=210409 RepID=UPI001E1CE8C2|nr:leucine-rich repeat extensin-like protein 5 [Portunus trituberculatus]